MVYRIGGLLVLVAVAGCCLKIHRSAARATLLAKVCRIWFALILLQAVLGAFTIWRNKPADVATLHVMFGAMILVVGAQLTLISSAQSWKMSHQLGRASPVDRINPGARVGLHAMS